MNENKIDVLQKHLSESEFELLGRVTTDFTTDPFQYCSITGEFEPTENWNLQQDLSDDVIDLMLKCCNILTQNSTDLMGEEETEATGSFTLRFEFFEDALLPGDDDLEVAHYFHNLLKGSPGYDVQVRATASGQESLVNFEYVSDYDFHRQKSDVYWLLQLARRKANNTPYGGTRAR